VFCAWVRMVWKGFAENCGLVRIKGCRRLSNCSTRLLWDFESGRDLLLPTRPSGLAAESAGASARVAMTACMSLRFNCSRSFRFTRRLWDLECRERANCKFSIKSLLLVLTQSCTLTCKHFEFFVVLFIFSKTITIFFV